MNLRMEWSVIPKLPLITFVSNLTVTEVPTDLSLAIAIAT